MIPNNRTVRDITIARTGRRIEIDDKLIRLPMLYGVLSTSSVILTWDPDLTCSRPVVINVSPLVRPWMICTLVSVRMPVVTYFGVAFWFSMRKTFCPWSSGISAADGIMMAASMFWIISSTSANAPGKIWPVSFGLIPRTCNVRVLFSILGSIARTSPLCYFSVPTTRYENWSPFRTKFAYFSGTEKSILMGLKLIKFAILVEGEI